MLIHTWPLFITRRVSQRYLADSPALMRFKTALLCTSAAQKQVSCSQARPNTILTGGKQSVCLCKRWLFSNDNNFKRVKNFPDIQWQIVVDGIIIFTMMSKNKKFPGWNSAYSLFWNIDSPMFFNLPDEFL